MLQYIFVIPYRDREHHKFFFERHIQYLLEDYDPSTYEVVFCLQNNALPFNRGAMKNCGFLYCKEKYPDRYKDLIYIFNDVDTLPYQKNLLNYELQPNEIKHYYGFDFTLGGIVAIRGSDFEAINGFPSLWYWGWEDTILYQRAIQRGIRINRDQFYTFGDTHILHMVHGNERTVSRDVYRQYMATTVFDGLNTLKDVRMKKEEMLEVEHFVCSYDYRDKSVFTANLVNGPYKSETFVPPRLKSSIRPGIVLNRPLSKKMMFV
jgi:hypothetical protein